MPLRAPVPTFPWRPWWRLSWALVLLPALACAPADPAPRADDGLATLAAWLTGRFTSADQAAADEGYHAIRLEMVPIWEDRADGPWLYVEQALAQRPDRPYRQRVYRVARAEDGGFVSEVYTFADPAPFVGAASRPVEAFADVGPEDLVVREGCAVYLERTADGHFAGATRGEHCLSTLEGAAYATSEVEVFADRLVSWDRGFDAEGRQVWGAERGGYVFRREDAAAR